MRSSRATMRRRSLASSDGRRERAAWSCDRCSTFSFRRNAPAATRWAAASAMRARRAVNRFAATFRTFESPRLERTKVRCDRRCLPSKTADGTSPRRSGASWRRASGPARCSFQYQQPQNAGASAVSTVLCSLPNAPPKSPARASSRPWNSVRATLNGGARGCSVSPRMADLPAIQLALRCDA